MAIFNIVVGLALSMFYLSGFLLWIVYRWDYRGVPDRERIVDAVFSIQVVLSGVIVYFRRDIDGVMGADGFGIFLVVLNCICTLIGIIAWLCEDCDDPPADKKPNA